MTHVRYGAISVLLVASLHAQVERATVTGTVTDQTGAVVPGASVVVHNQETGVEQKSQTNPDGHYTVPYLHPGSYAVVVQKDGFSRARVTGVNLTVGLVATVDVQLSLGTVQNEVRVEAAAVQLEQQSASL